MIGFESCTWEHSYPETGTRMDGIDGELLEKALPSQEEG